MVLAHMYTYVREVEKHYKAQASNGIYAMGECFSRLETAFGIFRFKAWHLVSLRMYQGYKKFCSGYRDRGKSSGMLASTRGTWKLTMDPKPKFKPETLNPNP